MPTLGPTELIIVLVIVIIVFGVGKLPEVGGALGKGIKEFRNATAEEEAAKAKETPDKSAQ
jgi:sec-independent protein translocase protein TatA